MSRSEKRSPASPVRTDRTRMRELAREAGRNLATGMSRGLLALAAFLATAGLVAAASSHSQVELGRAAERYLASGAAITTVDFPAGIDGAVCDSLATAPGVRGAGALRHGGSLRLATLPSREFQTFEATAGLATVLELRKADGGPGGLWLSQDVADTLGYTTSTREIPLLVGAASLGGVFPYPNDGRSPLLGYAVIAPVPADGVFDACWVDVGLDPQRASGLLLLPATAPPTGPGVTVAVPTNSQLNTTLGVRFDPSRVAGTFPLCELAAAGGLVGLVLGYCVVRTRRLELATSLHAGASRPTLCLQLLIEAAGWLLPAVCLGGAVVVWIARLGNPSDWWPVLHPGLRVVLLAGLGVFAGSLVAVLGTRESHLFRYFKAL